MAKKAIAAIEIDGGQEITRYTQLQIRQQLFGHHEFSLQVPIETLEGEGNYTFGKSKEIIGKTIKIVLESDQIVGAKSPPFTGIITNIGFVRSFGSGNDLLISGRGTTVLLDDGVNYRSFAEKGLADIVKEVLSDYPQNMVSCKSDPENTKSIPYVVQYQESNFHFLQRIADRYGEWMFYNGSELIFGKPEWPDAIPLLLGRDLYDFQLKMALAPTNYQAHYYDYTKSEVYHRAASDSDISNLDPAYGELAFQESGRLFSNAPSRHFNEPVADQKELDAQIERRVDQRSSEMVFLTGNSDHIGLGVGQVVSISGTKGEDILQGMENFGEFILTEIQHRVGGNGDYYNTFSAMPKEAGVPPLNPLIRLPMAEPEPAIVKENVDPDKLGRVRVQFYWQKGNEMTPWIRLVSSHGGKSGGFFVIPEKGDEVMVGYEHYHPDKPFAFGSIYNKKGMPSGGWNESSNNIKAIKTKSGNEIILNDTGGSEEIKILNKGGTNSIVLTMSEGGSITVTTNNQMNFNAKNIAIKAEEDIIIDARNVVTSVKDSFIVNAKNQVITYSEKETYVVADANLILDSTGGGLAAQAKNDVVLMSTDASVTVSGKTAASLVSETDCVLVQGKINVDIIADAQANLNSKAMTNVGSDGPVIVSGKILQLN